jgi:diguanylate cyclase (GGDEF)-like protein
LEAEICQLNQVFNNGHAYCLIIISCDPKYLEYPLRPKDMESMETTMSETCLYPAPSASNYFFEILEYEFHRAVRYKNAVTLMFIKLCHLDEIVGSYGQKTAECIISEIERIIRSNIRNTDRGFIYSKDEFMIILPNTPQKNASNMIPKLQRLIEEYRYTNGHGASLKLTPRFGLASYPNFEETPVEAAKTDCFPKPMRSNAVIKEKKCNAAL